MSKSKSRGYLQTLAKNPSAMPWADTGPSHGSNHLRSSSDAVERGKRMSHGDTTKLSVERQIEGLERSCRRLMDSIQRKVKAGNGTQWEHLASLLGNQRERLSILYGKRAEKYALPVVTGPRILPDLTVTIQRTGPTQKRFGQTFLNKGKLLRFEDI